jgi:hypothetical protein
LPFITAESNIPTNSPLENDVQRSTEIRFTVPILAIDAGRSIDGCRRTIRVGIRTWAVDQFHHRLPHDRAEFLIARLDRSAIPGAGALSLLGRVGR